MKESRWHQGHILNELHWCKVILQNVQKSKIRPHAQSQNAHSFCKTVFEFIRIKLLKSIHFWWYPTFQESALCHNHNVHFSNENKLNILLQKAFFKWNIKYKVKREIWKNDITAHFFFNVSKVTFSSLLLYIFILCFRLQFVNFKVKDNGKDANITNCWMKDKKRWQCLAIQKINNLFLKLQKKSATKSFSSKKE